METLNDKLTAEMAKWGVRTPLLVARLVQICDEHHVDDRESTTLDAEAVARRGDPQTSWSAAKMLGRENQRVMILRAFWREWPDGLTAEEACERAGLGRRGWQRVSDLRQSYVELDGASFVEPNGETRPTSTGSRSEVLVLTEFGRRWTLANVVMS